MTQNETLVIGLTGNSGSGKSTVAEIMKSAGALVVDADSMAHEIMLPGSLAYQEIVEEFDGVVGADGRIDRKKLAAKVFNDVGRKARLEEITHPYIVQAMLRQVNHVLTLGRYRYVVLDAPLLFEAGLQQYVHEAWVVIADEKTRLLRIMERDGISAEQAQMRLNAQTPEKTLINYADVVIENNFETVEELTVEVQKLLDAKRI